MSTMEDRARAAGIPTYNFDVENDQGLQTDPFRVWDEVGEQGPLFYSPGGRGFFVATDYPTIKSVLQDPTTWSSKPATIIYTREPLELHTAPVTEDPPEHAGYRRALNPLFSPDKVKRFEPRIREIVNQLIDNVLAQGECDFFAEFASQLPAAFFLEWLGLGLNDVQRMFELAMRGNYEFVDQVSRDEIDGEINSILTDLFVARRSHPEDDLATELLELELEGAPLPDDKLIEIGNLIFIAGQETTASSLGYMFWHLATHPEDRQQLVDDPSLAAVALEEMMRLYFTGGPVGRTATKATVLDGCPIEKGDRVFIARCTADRRVDQTVKLDRWPNRHSAFGLGPHRCLGAHVARLEMQTALELWHTRIPNYHVKEGFKPEHHSGFMQTLTTLPLVVDS